MKLGWLNALGNLVLGFLWGKIAPLVKAEFKKLMADHIADLHAKQDVQPLKDATTPEQVDAAATQAVDDL